MKVISKLLFLLIGFVNFSFANHLQQPDALLTCNKNHSTCYITFQDNQYQCAIGHSGVIENKKEGDGGTPTGSFKIVKIFYRADRINPVELKTNIPMIALTKNDGWCDDVNSPRYNKQVKLPFKESHEKLWREDHVYDIIATLNYNDNPSIKGKGSAIFLHVARENYSPTAGCIALRKNDLLSFLSSFKNNNKIVIQ